MGLDVYVYRLTAPQSEYDRITALNREMEQLTEGAWEFAGRAGRRYEQLSESERDECAARSKAIKVAFAKKHGVELGEWGLREPEEKVEIPSKTDPDHMFKIGYFRSSYNDGGINHILSDRVGVDLGDIMGAPGDGSNFTPDWRASRVRAVQALDQFQALLKDKGALGVLCIRMHDFGQKKPKNASDALAVFYEKNSGPRTKDFQAFGCREGEFYLGDSALKVSAYIPGESYGEPCMYVVYKNDEGMGWYVKALQIVIETCDYVLGQSDPQSYFLHWSG